MVSETKIQNALIHSHGNVSAAARNLRLSRRQLHRRILDSEALQEILQDQRETLMDDAEQTIANAIRSGDIATSKWYALSSRARRQRGYTSKEPDPRMENQELDFKIVEVVVESSEQVDKILTFEEYEELPRKA